MCIFSEMTLLAAYFSDCEQIIAADRRLIDGRTGKALTNQAYKLLQFNDSEGRYQFAVGFTGLATARGFSTMEWLISSLPPAFSDVTDINDAIAAFTEACSRTFSGIATAVEHKRTTFVFAGHIRTGPTSYEPGMIQVSNQHDASGKLLDQISQEFASCVSTKADSDRPVHKLRMFGDLVELQRHSRSTRRVWKYLHRQISSGTKLELVARLVRTVGRADSGVGKDILGLCIRPEEQTLAGEWPETKGRRETLPPLLYSNGLAFTAISLPPSLGKPLTDF